MKQTDRLLLGIVTGVIILVAVTFILVLYQPAPVYQVEDAPQNIAHNYLLALQQKEFERAYRYLSPNLVHYPQTFDQFRNDVQDNPWLFGTNSEITLAVESVDIMSNQAQVIIQEVHFYNRGLFNNSQSFRTFTVILSYDNDVWTIISADRYWVKCWHQTRNCP